jgi:hypothetical protein
MRCRLAALAVSTLAGSAAVPAAPAPFMEQHGHWTVMGTSLACMAVNRPVEEFNYAPYNGLSVRQRRAGPARLQVFAWPGLFKQGQAVTIAITVGTTRTELPAEAADTFFVETKEALPAALLDSLRDRRVAQFEVSGVPQTLLFDMSHLPAVMRSIEDCVRQLPNG